MIQNIWAVGRNYSEHAKELGNEVPTEPIIFLKAGSCAVPSSDEIQIPQTMTEVHHEVELALEIDNNMSISRACLALDLTDRAKQSALKTKGLPWTLAKSFKGACPLSDFFQVQSIEDLSALDISLKINGQLRQFGNTSQMIFPIERILHFVFENFPVLPGDLILTGTPPGVGPFKRGDLIEAEIKGKVRHQWLAK